MPEDESILEMAERHVKRAEWHVERQMAIINELRRDGHPTLEAESLLTVFEETLEQHREHFKIICAEQHGDL